MNQTIEINIDDYVSEEEKKELCIEYIKETLRGSGNDNHKERVLSNMAYAAAEKLLNSALTAEDIHMIQISVKDIIKDPSSYSLFRKKNAWGLEDSVAYLEVKKAVEKYKHLIDGLVLQAIKNRDYAKELNANADYIGEAIVQAITKGFSER